MLKALIDTSTYLDIRRAYPNSDVLWAQNTLRNFIDYRAIHPKLTISSLTLFEILDGIYRGSGDGAGEHFTSQVLPTLDVIYPDHETAYLATKISAELSNKGLRIGVVDTFIAATACINGLELVNANTKHFQRVAEAGLL